MYHYVYPMCFRQGEPMIFDPTLESFCATLSPEDADELRQERAAVFEIEGGMDRVTAEQRAGLRPPSRPPAPRPENEHF